jgi:hypothetical protein
MKEACVELLALGATRDEENTFLLKAELAELDLLLGSC